MAPRPCWVAACVAAWLLCLGLLPQRTAPANAARVIPLGDAVPGTVSHNSAIAKHTILAEGTVPHVVFLTRSVFLPGHSAPAHHHRDLHEVFYVAQGAAVFVIDGRRHAIAAGGAVLLAPHEAHEIRNEAPAALVLVYVAVATGSAAPGQYAGRVMPGPVETIVPGGAVPHLRSVVQLTVAEGTATPVPHGRRGTQVCHVAAGRAVMELDGAQVAVPQDGTVVLSRAGERSARAGDVRATLLCFEVGP